MIKVSKSASAFVALVGASLLLLGCESRPGATDAGAAVVTVRAAAAPRLPSNSARASSNPGAVGGFTCLVVNVTGADIPNTAGFGLLSNLASVENGATMSLTVPRGAARHFEVLGLVGSSGCTSTEVYSRNAYSFVTSLGSVTADIFADTDVHVRSSYDPLTAVDVRGGPAPVTASLNRVFLTQLQHDGNFGGIAGADAFCMADPAKPAGTSTYKALLSDATNNTRVASPNVNWVFKPHTQYFQVDGITSIGTTDANGLLPNPLTNPWAPTAASTALPNFWSGTMQDWTSDPRNDCVGYTSNTVDYGMFGDTNATNLFGALQDYYQNCGNTLPLVCVEQ